MPDDRVLTEDEKKFFEVLKGAGWGPVETAFFEALESSEWTTETKYAAYCAFSHAAFTEPRNPIAAWDAIGQEAQALMMVALDAMIDQDLASLEVRKAHLEEMKGVV